MKKCIFAALLMGGIALLLSLGDGGGPSKSMSLDGTETGNPNILLNTFLFSTGGGGPKFAGTGVGNPGILKSNGEGDSPRFVGIGEGNPKFAGIDAGGLI